MKILLLTLWFGGVAPQAPRQELAKEAYNYLYKHAACFYEGQEPPCDWYDEAYTFHWSARKLHNLSVPLRNVPLVTSDWTRGAYRPYTDVNQITHDWLVTRINFLIQFGEEAYLEKLEDDRASCTWRRSLSGGALLCGNAEAKRSAGGRAHSPRQTTVRREREVL